jgi:hypothetical protein
MVAAFAAVMWRFESVTTGIGVRLARLHLRRLSHPKDDHSVSYPGVPASPLTGLYRFTLTC